MTSPKLQREYERLYPNEHNPENVYMPESDHEGRATFWRWYIGVMVLVIIGVSLWAYYA
jgi:hypothetical protein